MFPLLCAKLFFLIVKAASLPFASLQNLDSGRLNSVLSFSICELEENELIVL